MPLTKQGDELVHAVGQGGRDESEAGCVTVDQLYTLYNNANCSYSKTSLSASDKEVSIFRREAIVLYFSFFRTLSKSDSIFWVLLN